MALRLHLLALLLILSAVPLLGAQEIRSQNYTAGEARWLVSNASAYVSTINESSYLFFSPRLSESYSYLSQAGAMINGSPDSAVTYAGLAEGSARLAYQQIGTYREISAIGALVFTAITAIMLYRFMKPVAGGRGVRNGR